LWPFFFDSIVVTLLWPGLGLTNASGNVPRDWDLTNASGKRVEDGVFV